jgi:hypothetical protein
MFAAFKIVTTVVIACVSVIAAIAESGHPTLFTCLFAAFTLGAVAAEGIRVYRRQTVRSLLD